MHAGHLTHKSVATSPIQGGPATQQGPMSVASAATTGEDVTADGKRSLPKGAHVRFSTVEMDGASTDGNIGSFYECVTPIQKTIQT